MENDQSGWGQNGRGVLAKHAGNVAAVEQRVERDDTGVSYEVRITLRDCPGAYEEGDGQFSVWRWRQCFGASDATCAGGSAFVYAAREQERAAEIAWSATREAGAPAAQAMVVSVPPRKRSKTP